MLQLRQSHAARPLAAARTQRGSVPLAPAASPSRRVRAAAKGGKITGRAPLLANPEVNADAIGYRFDAANGRWVRDDRFAGQFDPDEMVARPKTGTPFTVWPVMHTTLISKGMRSVTPEEALQLQEQGWTIVDVRLAADFEKAHAEGAVSLPLYRYVEGSGFWDNVKRGVMAVGFAMRATERDPDFRTKLLTRFPRGTKILLMCSIGGTLDTLLNLREGVKAAIPDKDRAFGRESRSLKAAYEFISAGWSASQLFWVQGGLQEWRYRGLPVE